MISKKALIADLWYNASGAPYYPEIISQPYP
jgi:hypothetical protein